MTRPLTDKQQKVLDYIVRVFERTGYVPTGREIAATMRITLSGAQQYLHALQTKGKISEGRGHRGFVLLDHDANPLIPIYGKVAAGKPIEASEHVLRTVAVPTGLFRTTPDYFVQVAGDSMVDELIFDGDLAGIKRADTASAGQIVLISVNTDVMSRQGMEANGINRNGLTLKIYRPVGKHVMLFAANREKNYGAFVLVPEAVKLEGIFVGTVRSHGYA